jgi:septum formation protein
VGEKERHSILFIFALSMNMLKNLEGKKIILASKSPRRQQLLSGLELDFEIRTKDVDEDFPAELKAQEIPLFLSKLKADAFLSELNDNEILITSDTVVWVNDHVLNKPENREHAIEMITELSGNEHHVYTAVSITSRDKQVSFYDETVVTFSVLSQDEIEHYIDEYKPYDKAGAYGAQDWIGLTAIRSLKGSYFNVMGLPVDLLYRELKEF